MVIKYEEFVTFCHFINYEIDEENEVITVKMIDSSSGQDEEFNDVFDFSNFPNGEMTSVETTLPINPIAKANRVNGELTVVLKKPVGF